MAFAPTRQLERGEGASNLSCVCCGQHATRAHTLRMLHARRLALRVLPRSVYAVGRAKLSVQTACKQREQVLLEALTCAI